MLTLGEVLDEVGAVLDAKDEGYDEVHCAGEVQFENVQRLFVASDFVQQREKPFEYHYFRDLMDFRRVLEV